MYPVVGDHRTENRLNDKRSSHTGGPHSVEMFGAIPVKTASKGTFCSAYSSPKGLAKLANPVIPVH